MRLIENLASALRQPARLRTLRLLFFVLAPFAYVVGVWLTFAHDPNTKTDLRLSRAEAIERAREVARDLGVNVNEWHAGHRIVAANDRLTFYESQPADRVRALRRIAPEVRYSINFIAPDGIEKMRVDLAHDGAPLGYERTTSPDVKSDDAGTKRAGEIADEAVRRTRDATPEAAIISIGGAPDIDEQRTSRGVRRTFTYRINTPEMSGVDARHQVVVRGEGIIERNTTVEFDSKLTGIHSRGENVMYNVSLTIYIVLTAVLLIYGFIRYFRLTQQKEAPHTRMIVASLLLGAFWLLTVYQIEVYLFGFPTSPRFVFWLAIGSAVVGYMMLGVVFGIAYASGEGDVREAYPGKLTSLDALLTGRVLSRNVAQSLLAGAALGGWALAAIAITGAVFADAAGASRGLGEKTWLMLGGSITGIVAAAVPASSGVWLAVFGLLLPLAFLHNRRLRSRPIFFLLLALICFGINLGHFADSPMSPLAGVLIAGLFAGVILAGFFVFDLLTVIAGVAAVSLATWACYLVAQPASSLYRAGLFAVSLALVVLLIESYFFLRGRTYAEDEVRPLYARHLAERVQMQAEESAAREAQERLMPQDIPARAGLEVAAVCLPAHTVGGDFYDLFALDDDRLGIFVAEGGGGGIGSALTIPFAKGFLMPRVANGSDPADVLCSLQTQLAPLLDQGQHLTVAFGVFDARARTFAYARTGDYPRVLITDPAAQTSAKSNGDAGGGIETTRELPGTNSESNPCLIRTANVELAPGATVIFFTDGIAKTLALARKPLAHLTRDLSTNAKRDSLTNQLTTFMREQEKRARRTHPDDDLTTVAVRFTAEAVEVKTATDSLT